MMKKFDAVLFDLDGVLVDACEWHYESLNRALLEFSGMQISRQDHIDKFNGLPTRVKLSMLGFDKNQSSEIESLKQKYTLETIESSASFLPEKIELMKYLKSSNIMIACVTNSIRMTATTMLEKTGQLPFFDLLVCNEDVERNKPFPDCYDLAIEKLKVSSEKCLCVEDSDKGFAAANASSAGYIWRVSGCHDVTYENYKRFLNENFDPNGR